MENNKIKLRKVPLEGLIMILEMLYEQGFDFVDIEGTTAEEQDSVSVYTNMEYLSEEFQEDGDDEEEAPKEAPKKSRNRKLSDDDLDQLM